MIESFLPQQSVDFVEETIDGILKKNGTLLSVSIIFTFYFATRGTTAMISELNATYHEIETRGFIKQKLFPYSCCLFCWLCLSLHWG
jgi:uncharacterized BrkB/YihY/UPF0761 family membrane protein